MQTNAEEYGPRDIIGYGPNPPDPQWPGGAKIAINLVRIGDSQTGGILMSGAQLRGRQCQCLVIAE